jgi:hypothetical protein
LVAGTHDQEDVFDSDDDDPRPEDHRQDAKHVFRVERQAVLGVKALTKSVDRACPNIAEHDAECSDVQPGKPGGCNLPVFPDFVFCGQRIAPGRDYG